jgi:hypothetical protein
VRTLLLTLSLIVAGAAVHCPPAAAEAPKWNDLTPEQQNAARRSFEEFQKLPPDQRTALRENYKRFSAMPPEKQTLIRARWEKVQAMTPEQRATLGKQLKIWRAMSPAERRRLIDESRGQGKAPREDRAATRAGKR